MFHFYVELASVHGIPAEQLTAGLPSAPDLLSHRRKWYGWDEHCEVMLRFERMLGGPEAADAAMTRGAYRRVVRPFNAIVSFLTTARGVYYAGFRWFAPSLFRHIRFGYEVLGPNCLRGTVEIPPGHRDCPEFFRMWGVSMRAAPLSIGLPASDVQVELTPRRAVYTIRLPARRLIWPRIWSWLRAVFRSSDVVDEVARHQQESKEAYEALLAQQRALLEGLPDLVVRLTLEGRIVSVSGARSHRLATAMERLLGQPLAGLRDVVEGSPEGLGERLLAEARAATDSGQPRMLDFSAGATAERTHFEWRTVPMGPSEVLCVVRDVTERKRLELQLVLSDRLASLGTLAASVAHEINNPLACVIANVSVAERLVRSAQGDAASVATAAAPSPAEGNGGELLGQALEAAERIRDIVGELRSLSRPDERQVGPVDLNPLLESVLRLASHQLHHRAEVTTKLEPVPRVTGNEGRLGQVFVNLLVNAAQAMPDSDVRRNRVRVSTRSSGASVVVEVSDNGRGISPDVLPRIFDPFFSTKPQHEGTGLGLAICHRIVTDLGGTIEVESTLGAGSTFRVTLPRHPESTAEAERSPSRATLAKPRGAGARVLERLRVLIIDDNARVAMSLKLLLHHHEVVVASGGLEGFERLTRERFDVALCDLMMPGVDGMELFRRVQRAKPGLERKIIFMTGGAFTTDARAFLESIPNVCLEKPFRADQLERSLLEVV